VKTLNVKHFRLVIAAPGKPVRYVQDASKKVLRPVRVKALALGAYVEMEEHVSFGMYRTIAVYEPETSEAGGAR
jgi:hypothetical protein